VIYSCISEWIPLRYRLKVKFNKDYVKISGETIEIGVKSKPKKGKANAEIIKKLASYFNVSSSSIKIIAGSTSKNKIIDVFNSKESSG
jgi:uncharacterized protein YggU (UPF0235/DUF167 family)